MSNVIGKHVITADSLGILSDGPVTILAVNFYPNAVSDTFQLKYWTNPTAALTTPTITYAVALATADHTVTSSSGNWFPSTWADGGVVRCVRTDGSDSSKYGLIKTAGNNTVFTVHLTPFTVESGKHGVWEYYPTHNALRGLQPGAATTHSSMFMSFGSGLWLPNLCIDALATSAQVEIFLKSS